MAPLEPIDRNINPDWPTLAEVVRTVAGNWDDGATTEEEVDEDGDLEGAFELPGRPVSLRNEHLVEDREVFDDTEVETLRVQRRAHRFYQTGTHAGSWSRINSWRQPFDFIGKRGMREDFGRGRRSSRDLNIRPIDYWRKFITDDMLDAIVVATKRRVQERIAGGATSWYAKRFGVENWPPRAFTSQQKKPMTRVRLEQWLSIVYGLGASYKRGISSAFSSSWLMGVPWVSKVMSCTEFKRIKSNLSCEVRNIDKVYPGGVGSNRDIAKIGVFLEMFRERCRQVYQPGEHLSYDEQVAKTDSRYTTLRQILTHKKYNGIQIYSVCEAGSGYLVTFATKFGDATRAREDAMMSLLADVQGRWHRVYADNLFINLRVLRDARDISVYLCGTARTNFGFPRPISKDVVKDLSKGEYTWRMSDDGITAILWHDTVPTQFLSNFHNPEDESSVFRRTKGQRERQARSAPQVAVDYNKYMGGVDQLDSLRGTASCNIMSMKWWHALFWWILDMAMVNAHHVYSVEEEKVGRTPMNRFDFIQSVVEELKHDGEHHGEETVENAPVYRKRASLDAGTRCSGLDPITVDRRARCKNCWSRKHVECKVFTACGACGSHLCVDCMTEWHTTRINDSYNL